MENLNQTISQPAMTPEINPPSLTRRDYLLVSFIGVSFALFSLPILNNIKLPFLKVNFLTAVILMAVFLVFANVAIWIAALIGRRIAIVFQFAKFSAVGAFNSFLDWGVLNLLIAMTGTAAGIGYVAFKGFSFLVANIGSYFWNKHWTFKSADKSNSREFGKFLVVSIIGLLINIGIAAIVVNLIGPKAGLSPERWANIGALSATVISLIWNFIGYKIFVFKK